MAGPEDDLVATKTEGYKAGEKKTLDEYAKLGTFISHHTFGHAIVAHPGHVICPITGHDSLIWRS